MSINYVSNTREGVKRVERNIWIKILHKYYVKIRKLKANVKTLKFTKTDKNEPFIKMNPKSRVREVELSWIFPE